MSITQLPKHIGLARCGSSAPNHATLCAAALMLITALGCTSSSEKDTATGEADQVVSPDWIHPACDATSLAPPSNNAQLCNGPWKYTYQEWWRNRDACGNDPNVCQTFNMCTSWDLNTPGDGRGYVVHTESQTDSGHGTSCTDQGGNCTPPQPDTICAPAAVAIRNQRIASIPGISQPAANGFSVTWVATNQTSTCNFDDNTGTGACFLSFRCSFTLNNIPAPATGAHPWCGCAVQSPAECPRGPLATAYSSPGIAQSSVSVGPPSAGSTRRTLVGMPSCTTCDAQATATDADMQKKFDCYDQGIIAEVGTLRSSLVARMKLLFQLAGERLTAAQRTHMEAVYDQDPTSAPVCSAPLTWDASCQPDADNQHLSTQLQLCNDLTTNPHASPGADVAEFPHCVSQLATLGGLGDSCRLAMRDTANTTVQTILEQGQPSFATNLSVTFPAALARIGTWWAAATTLAHGDRPWFLGESGALQRWLWTTVETQRAPLPPVNPTSDTDAATMLLNIDGDGFTNDIALISAAFGSGQTASSPLVLTVIGDALQALADRLGRLEPIHDVGCRFAACKGADGSLRTSATSEMVRALATLPDATAFAASVAAATHVQAQRPDLYAALVAMRDQHVYLETGWNLLGRPEPLSQLATVSDPPQEAENLIAIVRDATQAWASYQGSGEFAPWSRPRLTSAVLRQADLVNFISSQVSVVSAANTNYTDARLHTVQDLLDQSRSGASTQALNDQLSELAATALDVANRIDGITARETTERTALAGYQASFEALVDSGVLDSNAAYQTQTLTTLSASAADAKYPDNHDRNVVRDQFAMVPLNTGESLRIHVTGSWSPSCSVTTSTLVSPITNAPSNITLDSPSTGPEGYWVTWQNDSYHSKGDTAEAGSGDKTSLAVSGCVNLPIFGGFCLGDDGSSFNSQSNRDDVGSDSKVSAAFTTGIRLDSTPYPDAPAGSLVAVITRPGVTGGVEEPRDLDVRVIQRDDVIVAPTVAPDADWPHNGGVEVHFVVNDRGSPPVGTLCPLNPAALQIQMVKVTPFGNVAQQLGSAMADTLAAIELQAPLILAQGELSTAEETALRSDAWSRLETALQPSGIGVGGLPPELHQQFDAFLERELASIARRGQQQALELQLNQLGLQMSAIAHQLQFTADQNRLLSLVPRWRLRDLSGIALASSTTGLSEAFTSYVAPIFELRDPDSLGVFKGTTNSSKLIDMTITTNRFEDTVSDFLDFAQAASRAVGGAHFEIPADQARTLVIAIPRPSAAGRPAWTGPYQTVSDTTASAFWSSVFDSTGHPSANANITLSPSDIYHAGGGASRLSCQDLAPVVRHVGIYFATETSGPPVLGPAGVEIPGVAAATGPAWFPLVGAMTAFDSTDPLGIPLAVPALNGSTADVLGVAGGSANFGTWPVDLGAGAGISPFTAFRFDMRGFGSTSAPEVQSVLTNARAVFLVFDVDRRTSVPVVWVPGVCQLP